ncbi:dsrm-domain-containing protein [Exidia glandulosa HHB12029]|uniref:Dsrm-domain-containing protein n=1 Tax=Exidia glandulosa HHB12029 TaxID=1314781 RepID=A0A165JV08_EXIGL|nr:dsrm-domain-containing protein [Exidia glandulosa HHB12029]
MEIEVDLERDSKRKVLRAYPELPILSAAINEVLAEEYSNPGSPGYLRQLGQCVLYYATAKSRGVIPFEEGSRTKTKANVPLQYETLAQWARGYGLDERSGVGSGDAGAIEDTETLAARFQSYAGAVEEMYGPKRVIEWLRKLGQVPYDSDDARSVPVGEKREVADITNYRAVLNEWGTRQGKEVAWGYEQSGGAPHMPTWTATCKVDGQEYGRGKGSSKAEARENAARATWAKLVEDGMDEE